VFANISYLGAVLSNPLGWGWDLFGTAQAVWTPYLSGAVPYLQVVVLLVGLIWSSRAALRIAAGDLPTRPAQLQALPVALFCLGITLGLMWLLVA
jgi:hypothetical protein